MRAIRTAHRKYAERLGGTNTCLSHYTHGIPCCVHMVDLCLCRNRIHCARLFGQKKRPRRAVFYKLRANDQAVTPFAFFTYSLIWLKFRYL